MTGDSLLDTLMSSLTAQSNALTQQLSAIKANAAGRIGPIPGRSRDHYLKFDPRLPIIRVLLLMVHIMAPASAAQAYARIGLETGAAAASPQRLVVMLYDGALGAIADGRAHMLAGRRGLKSRALGKAIAIIGEGLRASLDLQRDGAIAQQLAELYAYIELRVFAANLGDDPAPLDEATVLLKDLRGAWATLAEYGPVNSGSWS